MFYGKPKYFRSLDPDEGGGEGDDIIIDNDDDETDFELGPSDEHDKIKAVASSYYGGGNGSSDPKGIPNERGVGNDAASAELTQEIDRLKSEIAAKDAQILSFKTATPNLENPIVKIAMGLAESGETDITKFISELSGKIPNVAEMSPEDKYEFYIRNNVAPKLGLSEDRITTMLTRFGQKEDDERISEMLMSSEFVETHRKAEIDKINAQLIAGKKAPVDDPTKLTEAQIQEADSKLTSYLGSLLKNKKFNGVDFTEEDSKHIDALAKNWFTLWDPKGNPMIEETVDAIHYMLNKKAIQKAYMRMGSDLAKGKKVDGIKMVTRQPGASSQGGTKPSADKHEAYIKSLPHLPT